MAVAKLAVNLCVKLRLIYMYEVCTIFVLNIDKLKLYYHIVVDTFYKRYLEKYFVEWNCLNFDRNFIEIWSNIQYSSIDSNNGSAPTKRQAIIRTNDDKFTEAFMSHLTFVS